MTRSSPATAGDNFEPLTEAQEEALQTFHEIKWNEIEAEEEKAAAALKGVRKRKSNQAKQVSQDLSHTRLAWEEYMADTRLPVHEFMAKEAARARLRRLGGLATDTQQELQLGDTVDDKVAAEKAGRRAYRAFADPVPPPEVSPILAPDWMRGWQDEQTKVAEHMAIAQEVIDVRATRPKPGEMVAGDDPDEDDDQIDVEDLVDQGARDLKANGWAAPTSEEAVFEEADGGKTVRKPRPSRAKATAQAEAA